MLKANLAARARLIFHPDELNYNFGAEHPLQPSRIAALMDLLETCGLWNSGDERYRLPLRAATNEELGLVHSADYIAAVQSLSASEPENEDERKQRLQLALNYGFADGDTPALPGMHEVTARIAGGSLVALSAVMGLLDEHTFATGEERPLHVFHPAG